MISTVSGAPISPRLLVLRVLADRYAVLLSPLFFKFLLLLLLLFQKKSRNLNLNSRYGTSRRPALLVVASLNLIIAMSTIQYGHYYWHFGFKVRLLFRCAYYSAVSTIRVGTVNKMQICTEIKICKTHKNYKKLNLKFGRRYRSCFKNYCEIFSIKLYYIKEVSSWESSSIYRSLS